jgi:ribose-phosphate pyrophosphokinase
MRKSLVIALPGNEAMTAKLADATGAETGKLDLHHFPDEETHLRFDSELRGRRVIFVCTLDRPDGKYLPLIFAAATARELGAERVGLVAPYLCYMRQDRRFVDGEAVSAPIFAREISRHFDWLITVDPHLHRLHTLSAIYKIPAQALHAAPLISEWIKREVPMPVVIGPDQESAQWAASVAEEAHAPFAILEKIRRGDRNVSIRLTDAARFEGHTPVLVDDIISTGRTMSETVSHLRASGLDAPVCIGVHGVFAPGALEGLKSAGTARIVTTNTISHVTNAIDVTGLIADHMRTMP